MTFSMIVKYKVFAKTLLFKACLSVKENDKSIPEKAELAV